MKKLFALFAALCVAVTVFAGEEPSRDNLINKQYDFRNFTGLSVSDSFDVELRQGNRYDVQLQLPGYLEPYLRVKVSDDVLYIGLDNLPRKIQQELNRDGAVLKATVTMPQLYTLRLSGAVRLRSDDCFKLDNYPFKMQLSGSSRVDQLEVKGKGKAYVRASGASSAVLQCSFDEWDVELSGSSGLRQIGGARKLEADQSGASWSVFEGSFEEADVETSGSAKIRITGAVGKLEVDGSGASSVEVGETQDADVELSGASKCKLSVQKRLKVDLTGASSCRYHAPKNLDVEIETVSRGATLQRL